MHDLDNFKQNLFIILTIIVNQVLYLPIDISVCNSMVHHIVFFLFWDPNFLLVALFPPLHTLHSATGVFKHINNSTSGTSNAFPNASPEYSSSIPLCGKYHFTGPLQSESLQI